MFTKACHNQQNSSPDTLRSTPNILFAISDDQSFPHASAYGDKTTLTPIFDAIAQRGVLFNNAFVAAPQCSPSRAAILTGRNIWQLEEAGTHSSYFPKKFPVFTDALVSRAYKVGFTGKPWGPGNWKDAGRIRNPAGEEYNQISFESVPYSGIRKTDYAANFEQFISEKKTDVPFFFWYGASEPHRVFEEGSGLKEGKDLSEVNLPAFLPDHDIIRSDILDYAVEIEWFDTQLGKMIKLLEEKGELENTIIVITADNGMAFPAAKANLQEFGTHVPLAIAGPNIVGNRVVDDLVSLIDLAPTFLEMSGTPFFDGITGKSLRNILQSTESGIVDDSRQMVLTGRERHTHARPDNLGYPSRAIRTHDYLYIHNMKPNRWPAGDPAVPFDESHQLAKGFKSMKDGYHDIDACPSKSFLLDFQDEYKQYFDLAVAKRPATQLFDIKDDPACVHNLSGTDEVANIEAKLKAKLIANLTAQGDPRMLGYGDIFESYPRFAGMREFDGFRERGQYNPKYQLPSKQSTAEPSF